MLRENEITQKDLEERINEKFEKLAETDRSDVVIKALEVFDQAFKKDTTEQNIAAK